MAFAITMELVLRARPKKTRVAHGMHLFALPSPSGEMIRWEVLTANASILKLQDRNTASGTDSAKVGHGPLNSPQPSAKRSFDRA